MVVGSGVHGLFLRMGCENVWMEGVKITVYSCSEMNVMDGIERMMELQRERNDHS